MFILGAYATLRFMAEFEEETFRVVKVDGAFRNDLGEMSGQELYGYIGTQLGEDKAADLVSVLEKQDSASVSGEGYIRNVTFEIQRIQRAA